MAILKFDDNAFFAQQQHKIDAGFARDSAVALGRLTRQTVGVLYEYRVPRTPWASEDWCTIDMGIDPGASSVDWDEMEDDPAAGSSFVSEGAPIPFSDVRIGSNNNGALSMKCGFRYTEQEAASANLSGMNLPTIRGRAAKRKHDYDLDNKIRVAVLNIQGCSQMTAGDAPGTTAGWASGATPDQIVASFEAVWTQVDTASNTTIEFDTVVFPSTVGATLRGPRMIGSETTILEWMQRNFPGVKTWAFDSKQNTAGIGGTAVMSAFNSEDITPMMSLRLQPMPMFVKHDVVEQGFRSRYFGLRAPYPKGCAHLSGI